MSEPTDTMTSTGENWESSPSRSPGVPATRIFSVADCGASWRGTISPHIPRCSPRQRGSRLVLGRRLGDLGLVWQRPYTQVLDTSRGIPWTRWYVGGQFNYVETALDKRAEGASADKLALIWEGEEGAVRG